MSMNRIQFQKGLSLPEFQSLYGTEEQCEAALEKTRWPDGYRCSRCQSTLHCVLHVRSRKTFQCGVCNQQTSLIAGTLFHSTKLPLTTWFLAIYLVSQSKNNLSALSLKRQLGICYRTAWRMKHKLMEAMARREDRYTLEGRIEVDDAYLGGEHPGGKRGRGSENKIPFVAAVSTNEDGHPMYAKLSPVSGFTQEALESWGQAFLAPGSTVISDRLACFTALSLLAFHLPEKTGGRKPKDLPQFHWVNTILGNLKSALSGTYHAFDFSKYARRYLSEFSYRFNRRFHLKGLPVRLLVACATTGPCPERWLRLETEDWR